MKKNLSISEASELLSVTTQTLRRWDRNGKLKAMRNQTNNYRYYQSEQLSHIGVSNNSYSIKEEATEYVIEPLREYKSIELFAGAGGLALGMEKAGIGHVLLNDFDRYAVETLKKNRPNWNVIGGDVADLDFKPYHGKVDLLTGGFPCQAFSYAGKKLGTADIRGTLFNEFAKALKESQPSVFMAENVRGLLSHENGRTLSTMIEIFKSMGYVVLEPKLLRAIHFQVPQKRERIFIVGIKKELAKDVEFQLPKGSSEIYTIKDALKKGKLYPTDVEKSEGQIYPEKKKRVLELVPPGGYWRDLPLKLQKEYMM
ncbi:MAG: DNA (cytosine-5-)-methyltransferase, partial [Proteobacteria bacterium]|nr:DNA (cytosine-5-)-methyltransferase [Pseudomonadota bacterium]